MSAYAAFLQRADRQAKIGAWFGVVACTDGRERAFVASAFTQLSAKRQIHAAVRVLGVEVDSSIVYPLAVAKAFHFQTWMTNSLGQKIARGVE